MELGLLVMVIIIIVTIVVMSAVMFYGLKHDPHMDVRSPESSRAVQILQTQNSAAAKKLAEIQTQSQLASESAGGGSSKAGGSALGSDEEKAARKAAALARKAAKQG